MSDFITGNSYIFPILIGVLVLLIFCFIACFCRSRRMRYLRKSADHHAFNHTAQRLDDLNSFTTRCLDEAFSKAFPPVDEKDPAMRLILLEMLKEALGGTGIEVKDGASSRTVSGAALPSTTPPRSPQRGSSRSSSAKRSPSKGKDSGESTPLRFVFKTTKVEAVAEQAATASTEASSTTRRKVVAFEITELPTSAEIVNRLQSSTILLAYCRRGGIAAYSALGRYVQRSGSKVFDDIALPRAAEDDNDKSKARRRKNELETSTPNSMWGCWCCCCLPRSKQREYFHKRRRLYWFGLSSMFCSALNLNESEQDMERRLREKRHGAKLQNASRMVGGAISPGSKRNTTHFTPIPPPLEGHSGTEMSAMSSPSPSRRGNAHLGSRYASPPPRGHHHEGVVDKDAEEVAALMSDKKYNNLFLFMGSALSRKMISVCPVVRDRITVAKHPNAPRSAANMGATNDNSEQLEPEFSIKITEHPDLMSEFNTKRYIRAIFQPTMPATEEVAISEAYNTRVSRQSQSTSLMSASSTGIPVSAHLVVEGGISRTSSLSRPSPSSLAVENVSGPNQQQSAFAAAASASSSTSRATAPPSVTTEHALVEQLQDMFPDGLPLVSDELDASHFSCDTVRDDLYVFFQNLQTTLYHGDMLGNEREYYPMYDAIPAFDEAVKKWYLQVCMLAATTCARSFAAMVATQSKKLCEKEIRNVVDRLGAAHNNNNLPQRRLDMGSPQSELGVGISSSPDHSRPSSPLSNSLVSHHIAAAKKWSLNRVPSADTVRGEVVDLIKSRLQQQIALFRDCHLVNRYALMRYEGGPIVDQLLKKCTPALREADHFDESLVSPAVLLFPSHAPVLALHSEQPLPLPRQLTQPQDVPLTIEDAVWYFGQGVDRLPVELAADEICMKDARRSIKRLRGELLDLVFSSAQLSPSSSNNRIGDGGGFSPRESAAAPPPPPDNDGPVPPPRIGMSSTAVSSPSPPPLHHADSSMHLGTSGLSLSEQVVTVTFRNLVKGIEEHLKIWVALSEERVAGSLIYHLDPDGKDILAGWQSEVDHMSSSLVRHVATRYNLIRTTVSLSLRVVQLSLRQIYQFLANLQDQPKHSKKDGGGDKKPEAASTASAPTTRHSLPLKLPLPPKFVAAHCGDLVKEAKNLRRVALELASSCRADADVADSVKSPTSSGQDASDEPSAFSQNAAGRRDDDVPDPYAVRSLLPHLKPSLYFHPTDVLMIVEAAFNVIGSTTLSPEEGDAPDALQPLPPNLFEGL